MKLPAHYGTPEPPDFRSREFCHAAWLLVRATGCSLVLCRQELFIAEGDLLEARAALLGANGVRDPWCALH